MVDLHAITNVMALRLDSYSELPEVIKVARLSNTFMAVHSFCPSVMLGWQKEITIRTTMMSSCVTLGSLVNDT